MVAGREKGGGLLRGLLLVGGGDLLVGGLCRRW